MNNLEKSRNHRLNHQLERAYQNQLKKFILSHKEILSILKELVKINHDCYICAGIIRNSIWSHLHVMS